MIMMVEISRPFQKKPIWTRSYGLTWFIWGWVAVRWSWDLSYTEWFSKSVAIATTRYFKDELGSGWDPEYDKQYESDDTRKSKDGGGIGPF